MKRENRSGYRLNCFLLFLIISLGIVSADTTKPTTIINSPESNSWQNQNFVINITDYDTESGLALCEYRVYNDVNGDEDEKDAGELIKDWTERSCNNLSTITVGNNQDCRTEGTNRCKVQVKATDNSNNTNWAPGLYESRKFSIDWTPPVITLENQAINKSSEWYYLITTDDGAGSGIYGLSVSNENFTITSGEEGYKLTNKTELQLGTYNVSITAVDNAGNPKTETMIITALEEGQKLAKDENIVVGKNETELVFNLLSANVKDIIIPDSIDASQEIKLDFSAIKTTSGNITNVSLGENNLKLKRQSNYNYSAEILPGTTISGNEWNGKLILPTIKSSDNYSVNGGSVGIVVDFGGKSKLEFSKAVKIILGSQTGKKAGWAQEAGVLTPITTICNNATDYSNIDTIVNRECYFDYGSDLIIWSYHLTSFASFDAFTLISTTEENTATGGSSGIQKCKTEWTCTEWSNCSEGTQRRICEKKDSRCEADTEKPIEQQSCIIEEAMQEKNENTNKISRITGAFAGALKTPQGWGVVVIFIVAGISMTLVKNNLKKKIGAKIKKKGAKKESKD